MFGYPDETLSLVFDILHLFDALNQFAGNRPLKPVEIRLIIIKVMNPKNEFLMELHEVLVVQLLVN